MAKTTVVMLTCDRCQSEDGKQVEGAESVHLGSDGWVYEADLCRMHADEFHRYVQSFVGIASSRARGGAPRSSAGPAAAFSGAASGGGARTDKARLDAIRTWARENGHEVSDRGRIAGTVTSAYDAANA